MEMCQILDTYVVGFTRICAGKKRPRGLSPGRTKCAMSAHQRRPLAESSKPIVHNFYFCATIQLLGLLPSALLHACVLMFDHLVSVDEAQFVPPVIEDVKNCGFVTESKVSPADAIDAKFTTSEWLKELGAVSDEDALTLSEQKAATEAFATMSLPTSITAQKQAVSSVNTPQAVRHLVGMLTAYDWNFVEQAQSMRSYAISKILEETTHPDARIRLKALEMLGKVTEVSLFTERIEVKKVDMSDADLEEQIRNKLRRFMGVQPPEIVDAVAVMVPEAGSETANEAKLSENESDSSNAG